MKLIKLFIVMLFVFSSPVRAEYTKSVNFYTNLDVAGGKYEYDESDSIVVKNGTGYVIRKDMGMSCPLGQLYLVNQKDKTYRPLTLSTCDDRAKLKLNNNVLSITLGKKPVAKYDF